MVKQEMETHNEVINFTFRAGYHCCAVNKTRDHKLVKMGKTNDHSLTSHHPVHNVLWIRSLNFISY